MERADIVKLMVLARVGADHPLVTRAVERHLAANENEIDEAVLEALEEILAGAAAAEAEVVFRARLVEIQDRYNGMSPQALAEARRGPRERAEEKRQAEQEAAARETAERTGRS